MSSLISKFDDVVRDEDGVWSHICDECIERLGVDDELLSDNAGYAICGVIGCENDADHYINF